VIKAAGAARGRELRTIINPMIVCRETDREATTLRSSMQLTERRSRVS
jgi:alkanesulfonate monooxygenase SsuD/methylene tetrahydromethanopterin reductase-like flavin-dependent oxidoreductase (luciferase family)